MQQPSSLIFLAIVVIWAAYLLQHWIRRREALATARSVDQFSDAMRVLERREHPVEIEDVAEQNSQTPNASRPSAPQARASVPRPSLRAGTVMTGETMPAPGPSTDEQDVTAATEGAARRIGRVAATAGSPKLRAVALIASVSVLLITVVCAPFGALPWWSPILMLAASGGAFYWCRVSAMAAVAGQQSTGSRGPQHARKAAAEPAATSGRRPGVKLPKRTAPAPAADPVPVIKATMPAPVAPDHAPAAVAPQPVAEQVFDVSASAAAPAPAAVVAEAEGSWRPVAVPPPTYTMKERAPERPHPAPAPTTERKSYEHVANEDLPFDGLALDQDLDDLPAVFRAG